MLKFFKKLFLIKKVDFSKMPQKEVVLYDQLCNDLLENIVPKNNIYILIASFEYLNLRILLKLFFLFKLNSLNYFAEIINEIQPKAVITFVDNDEKFWLLKNKITNPTIKFVIIQNGLRNDIFSRINYKKKKYSLDDMFFFNKNIGKYYSDKIVGNIHSLGSFKNNFYNFNIDNKEKNINSILFISSIDPFEKDNSKIMYDLNGYKVSYNKYYEADCFFLMFLKKYCENNNIKLSILGRNYENRFKEKKIFNNLLSDFNFNYIDKTSKYSEFEEINKYELIVTLDSTLGYEALAHKIKVCFFSIREHFFEKKEIQFKFGWPLNLPDTGFFWTNEKNEKKFEKILDDVRQIPYDDWKEKIKDIYNELMIYSPQNKKFSDYLIENDISVNSKFIIK